MMQVSDPPPPPPLHPNPLTLHLDLSSPSRPTLITANPNPLILPSWPSRSSPAVPSPSLSTTFNSASCMEQLLVDCAHAVDLSDSTLAHQLLWVLNTISSHPHSSSDTSDSSPTHRLTSAFLRSLISRASSSHHYIPLHRFSPTQLAAFVDLTPFHRFGYSAANAAISEASDSFPILHIVDLSTTHCMQIPTLIDSLASRYSDSPPLLLRLTVPFLTTLIPPLLDFSYDDLGSKLVNFARSRNILMEFRAIPSNPSNGFETLIEQIRLHRLMNVDEALIINCHMLLHYIPDETCSCNSMMMMMRSMFLKNIRSLEPNLVTFVDEDVDLTSADVVGRLRSAFNYLWIPYDAAETTMVKGSERREWYEGGIRWKIENVIAREGEERVERAETRGRWAQRMRGAGFRGVGFGEEAVGEVKAALEEHAAPGWGMKREDDVDLVLTWKGHNVVFATAWVPC